MVSHGLHEAINEQESCDNEETMVCVLLEQLPIDLHVVYARCFTDKVTCSSCCSDLWGTHT